MGWKNNIFMGIEKDNKFYRITTLGVNKFYYYLYVSGYDTLSDMENLENPISEEYFKFDYNLVNPNEPVSPQIYNLLLTTDTFKGGILIGG
jgi:hypothetical protein